MKKYLLKLKDRKKCNIFTILQIKTAIIPKPKKLFKVSKSHFHSTSFDTIIFLSCCVGPLPITT